MTRKARAAVGTALVLTSFAYAFATAPGTAPQSAPAGWPVRPTTPRPAGPRVISAGDFAGCQPESFDGRPPAMLEPRCEYSALRSQNADGFGVHLQPPFQLTLHRFRDPIDTTYAIEITRGNTRHALLSHVDEFDADSGGRTLTLVGWRKTGINWQSETSIVDVLSGKTTSLPALNCTQHTAPVGPLGAVTYGDDAIACLWTLAGTPEAALTIPPMERAAEGRLPGTSLARVQGGLGVVLPSRTGNQACDVLLTRADGRAARRFSLDLSRFSVERELDQRVCAGALEIDWASIRVESGAIRYRVSPTGWLPGKRIWSNWLIAAK